MVATPFDALTVKMVFNVDNITLIKLQIKKIIVANSIIIKYYHLSLKILNCKCSSALFIKHKSIIPNTLQKTILCYHFNQL